MLNQTNIAMKKSATVRASKEPYRVMVVGDTIISERGLVAIVDDDPCYRVCAAAQRTARVWDAATGKTARRADEA
jgi:hypothetical protein